MSRRGLVLAVAGLALMLGAPVARADGGGPQEVAAKAMLERAVVAVKADSLQAMVSFTKRSEGFGEGDLYVFCARARSGWVVAHPYRLGENIAQVSDVNGKLFGKEMLHRAKEGQVSEIHYMWPRPGEKTPVQKDTFFTKVKGLVCGVGYYPG